MNKVFGYIFTLVSFNSFACYYNFSNGHDEIFKGMENSSKISRCTGEIDRDGFFVEKDRDDTCECAQDNLDLFPPNTNVEVLTDTAKIPFLHNIRDKAQIALLSLTEEISNLDRQFNKSQHEFNMAQKAKSCLLEDAMIKDTENSVFHCENEAESIISKSDRKKMAQELFSSFENEMVYAKKGKPIPEGKGKGLVDREKNQNSCKNPVVSDEFISDLRDKSVEDGLVEIISTLQGIEKEKGIDLRQMAFEKGASSFKSKKNISLLQILDFVKNEQLLSDSRTTMYFNLSKNKLLKSPLLRAIVNDPTKYDEIIKLKEDAKGSYPNFTALKESLIDNEKFREEKLAELNSKCENAMKAFKKSLCVTKSDNIIPADHQKVANILRGLEDNNEGGKPAQEKYWASSQILVNSVCKDDFSEKDSVLKDIGNIVNADLAQDFNNVDSFDVAVQESFRLNVTSYANYMCDLLENDESGKEIRFPATDSKVKSSPSYIALEKNCQKNSAGKNTSECIKEAQITSFCVNKSKKLKGDIDLGECISTVSEANDMLNAKGGLRDIVISSLEEQALAEVTASSKAKNEVGVSEEALNERAKKLANERASKMNTADLMSAYNDVKDYANGARRNLTAQIFNIKSASISGTAAVVDAGDKDKGSDTKAGNPSRDAKLSGGSTGGGSGSRAKNFNIGNPFSQKKIKQLANFNNVQKNKPSRSIPVDVFKPGSFSDSEAVNSVSANGQGSSSVNASQSRTNRSTASDAPIGASNYKIAEENYNDHSDGAGRTFDPASIPKNPVKTIEEERQESYNKALGAAYEAKKKGFDPAAVSGVSIKPASSDGSGSDGGSLSIAGAGGANGKGFDGAFDSIIANAQTGLDSEQYQKIRDFFLSDKKELEIASFEDPSKKVILKKEPMRVAMNLSLISSAHAASKKEQAWKIKVVPAKTSNEADEGFIEFYQNIKNSRHVKNNFKDFIAAMDEKSVYNEMLKLFNSGDQSGL